MSKQLTLRVKVESHHVPSSQRLSKFEVKGPTGVVRSKHLRQVRDAVLGDRKLRRLNFDAEIREGAVLVFTAPDDSALTGDVLALLRTEIEAALAALRI